MSKEQSGLRTLNLVVRRGQEAAERFLTCYRQLSGAAAADQPYWDLRTVVDLMPDDGLEIDALARLEPYLSRLLSTL